MDHAPLAVLVVERMHALDLDPAGRAAGEMRLGSQGVRRVRFPEVKLDLVPPHDPEFTVDMARIDTQPLAMERDRRGNVTNGQGWCGGKHCHGPSIARRFRD